MLELVGNTTGPKMTKVWKGREEIRELEMDTAAEQWVCPRISRVSGNNSTAVANERGDSDTLYPFKTDSQLEFTETENREMSMGSITLKIWGTKKGFYASN